MTPEGEQFYNYLVLAHDNIFRELEAVSPQALNWPLGVPETNTLYGSAYHSASSTEYWMVVYVGGESLFRDRSAEFRATGDLASLKARWQQALSNAHAVLGRLTSSEFEALRTFSQGGAEQRWPVRECLLHVVEQANVHLGHIQIARQLWEQEVAAEHPADSSALLRRNSGR